MQPQTVIDLNKINYDFYHSVTKEFDESRAYYWQGWRELLPYLTILLAEKETLSVLDLGCGNGRFAEFLKDNLPAVSINYTGIDNNDKLLKIAEKKLKDSNLDCTFKNEDMVSQLLADQTILTGTDTYDLIISFGVVHHIPSYSLRTSFFEDIGTKLNPDGLAILTLWKFMDIARLEKKQLSFENTHIQPDQLEKNDYLIAWYRGTNTFRYCHYTDEAEQEQLVRSSQLELIDTFEADGKEGRGNTYLVLNQPNLV